MDTTHYSTPNDRDGDYSYAYDSSLSPAFIIKYDDGGEGSSEDEGKCPHKKAQQENIYEEIAESHRSEQSFHNLGVGVVVGKVTFVTLVSGIFVGKVTFVYLFVGVVVGKVTVVLFFKKKP